MKHWCKLKTETINNETLFELPESAQLCYYKLHSIAAMCDAGGALVKDDGSPLTIKGLAFRLHSSEEATGYNIAALVRAKLINQTDGIISLPDFECEAADYTNAERQRRFKERKKALPNVTAGVTVTPDENSNGVTVTPDENSNGVTVTPVTALRNTEEKRREENREEVFAQSANPLQQKQKTKTQREQNPRGDLFVAVASLCKIPTDDKRSARAINATTEWLLNKDQTPERLEDFLNWWNTNDWRGKKGDPPKPNEIVTEWLKFEAGLKQQQTNGSKPTAQMPSKKMMLNGVEVYI